MEEKLGQSTAVLFKYEKLILAEEETTSAGGCGVSLAAFSRPASACPSDRLSLSKKSGWSWAFSDRYGRMGKGDARCWNAGKWIEIW